MRLRDCHNFTGSRGSIPIKLYVQRKDVAVNTSVKYFLYFEFRAVLVPCFYSWFEITHLGKSGLDCHSLGKLRMSLA